MTCLILMINMILEVYICTESKHTCFPERSVSAAGLQGQLYGVIM